MVLPLGVGTGVFRHPVGAAARKKVPTRPTESATTPQAKAPTAAHYLDHLIDGQARAHRWSV
ncbi:hypothetical protein ACGFIY_17215 [Micromonospora chersina]|uniref:hypothetical protein n=1 Tax=Micromonospora chersina TaxID=47854 RepID=UPI0037108285